MSARRMIPACLAVLAVALVCASGAMAAPGLILQSRFGGEVNTNGTNICTAAESCQNGTVGEAAGWFKNPYGVAVNESTGNVYVSDQGNQRVDEYGPEGKFILSWGTRGEEPGQFTVPRGVAVDNTCYEQGLTELTTPTCKTTDPSNGDVYVVDRNNNRVQVFEPEGNFIVMFGGGVDATTGGNVCPESPGDTCQTGTEGTGPGAFEWGRGNFIAVGSRIESSKVVTTVYVGDNNRVQEFDTNGVYQGEVALPGAGKTTALAVDSSGDVYAMSEELTGVREYSPSGAPLHEFDSAGIPAQVKAIAVTATGDVIVSDQRLEPLQGAVYKVAGSTVEELSTFGEGAGSSGRGLAFDNATETLYVAEGAEFSDVEVFKVVPLPTARTTMPAQNVQPTTATVTGEVNPEGIEAEGFFEYGPCTTPTTCEGSPYGQKATAVREGTQNIHFGNGSGYVKVEATVEGLQPNKTYHYLLVGHNVNGNSAAKQEGTFITVAVKPVIESRQALFLTPHTAELAGSVNPENDATAYLFEYGPCVSAETCASSPYPYTTGGSAGEGYGAVALYREVEGLQPSSTYHYRLVAENGQGPVESAEGTFTTPAEPAPVEPPPAIPPAVGIVPASGVSAGAATLHGEVDPNNAPTTYRFELAAGSGAGALYTTIASGQAGSGGSAVGVATSLAGLQPGTTYSYRLVAVNAYGSSSAEGTFTTPGFAAAFTQPIAPLVFVTPSVALPKEPAKVTPKKLTRAQTLAHALKACAKKPKNRRAACRRTAQKRYGSSKKKTKK